MSSEISRIDRWTGRFLIPRNCMNPKPIPRRQMTRPPTRRLCPDIPRNVTLPDYYSMTLPEEIANDPSRGRFSNYAWAADYHERMLPRLQSLADFRRHETGLVAAVRAYVDTGAILERSHAEEAGLGFVGKNTTLIHPRRGSFFFLGEIITDLDLPPDEISDMPGCGSCTRCLSACPTGALVAPYRLDARLCISYLTIELKGFIPRELRPLIGNWVY